MGADAYMSQRKPNSDPAEIEDLEQAFNLFNQVSEQLAGAYRDLEGRVEGLNNELESAQSERLTQLNEKERLANRLQSLLNAMPAGVVVLDSAGNVQESNPAALDLLGEPLLGIRWLDILQRSFAPRPDDGQDISLQDGRRVSISTSSLGDEPGQILLLHDVTETHAMQDRLDRNKRLSTMGEMAASLAHQIRTPLSSAMLYVSQLSSTSLDSDNKARFSSRALGCLKQLEQMVNDMLLFARGGTSAKQQLTISSLLGDLQNIIQPHLEKASVSLDISTDIPAQTLSVNKDALIGALHNLINNAIDATENNDDNASILLKVTTSKTREDIPAVEFIVSDNGPGIPPENQERVFEPFFTTHSKGTGLGLAVVQAVAKAHCGVAWVDSDTRPDTSGTTITMYIPVAEQQEVLFSGQQKLSDIEESKE
ncbi:MAG: sensor histidine kinase FleS [Gammaproteobacteria bacterium]|nr:MAG: sensor histidine kinase FleS [Gammaproteobacteria bacterium]